MAWLDIEGCPVFYDIRGAGSPVLLFHSLAGSGDMWTELAAMLARHHTVILPDARGHGRTPPGAPLSVERQAEDGAAILSHLGLSRVKIIGLSMGGQAALHLAAKEPRMVGVLVLADTSLGQGTDGSQRRDQVCGEIEELGWEGFTSAYILSRTVRPGSPGAAAFARGMRDMEPAHFVEQSVSISRQDMRDKASGIEVPALVIVGGEDVSTPPQAARAVHEAIARSELAIIPQAGHLSVLDQPKAFGALVTDFFGRTDEEAA